MPEFDSVIADSNTAEVANLYIGKNMKLPFRLSDHPDLVSIGNTLLDAEERRTAPVAISYYKDKFYREIVNTCIVEQNPPGSVCYDKVSKNVISKLKLKR